MFSLKGFMAFQILPGGSASSQNAWVNFFIFVPIQPGEIVPLLTISHSVLDCNSSYWKLEHGCIRTTNKWSVWSYMICHMVVCSLTTGGLVPETIILPINLYIEMKVVQWRLHAVFALTSSRCTTKVTLLPMLVVTFPSLVFRVSPFGDLLGHCCFLAVYISFTPLVQLFNTTLRYLEKRTWRNASFFTGIFSFELYFFILCSF